jgi:hypothetical protein
MISACWTDISPPDLKVTAGLVLIEATGLDPTL